ncbi:TIGR01620 family protein [Pararhodobacter oceanensis]|uniref:TIGR01620 family protein n=1 Tax=Pararhodobacter oceanensis TaxID=2172121 RepID=A0A2T8HW74_9RHOB|nr:TIGR01620 family protein [Pararhodobacter oceanensis]PVH29691.1 TIGR01620 family protein [Pararhodobacter oceanensis]
MSRDAGKAGASGPVMIELDEPAPDIAAAPEIPDPEGAAMQAAMGYMARPAGGGVGRWIWGAAASLLTLVLGVAAYDFAADLIARMPVLGWLAAAMSLVLALTLLVFALREVIGLRRLRRLDRLRARAEAALAEGDLGEARAVAQALAALYGAQGPDPDEALDAEAALEGVEAALLIPIDARVEAEIEAAARQVALATALIPLAFADVAAALAANLRMIRRIATLYGGRPGSFGNWRLLRTVALHLMATGLVAVGDDVIGSLAGGGVMSKISRRFGEGVVNGALTARVGVAAMEICRPMPFRMGRRPSVSALTARALRGLFSRA